MRTKSEILNGLADISRRLGAPDPSMMSDALLRHPKIRSEISLLRQDWESAGYQVTPEDVAEVKRAAPGVAVVLFRSI